MTKQDFTLTLSVDQSPQEVFDAINDVRGWWSRGLEGESANVGDEFTYRHEDLHRSTHKVIEATPGQKVVWRTLDADLSHANHRTEWIGTEIHFDIARRRDKTELRFTHRGLAPELDCFDACSKGWSYYIHDSLRRRITTGAGNPDPAELAAEG